MGRSASDNLSKGMGCSDVRIVLEHVVKHSQRKVRFEWKKMKGRASNAKGWSIHERFCSRYCEQERTVCGMWEGEEE